MLPIPSSTKATTPAARSTTQINKKHFKATQNSGKTQVANFLCGIRNHLVTTGVSNENSGFSEIFGGLIIKWTSLGAQEELDGQTVIVT